MKKCSNPCSRAWHQSSEFGEWRFERKCFRANIETSAAKTRRSRIFFLLISVEEEFRRISSLHFYTEDRSFVEVRTSIYRKNDSIFPQTLAVEQPSESSVRCHICKVG